MPQILNDIKGRLPRRLTKWAVNDQFNISMWVSLGHPVKVTQIYVTNQPMFRVRVGPLTSVEAADQTLDRVVVAGYPDARIIVD